MLEVEHPRAEDKVCLFHASEGDRSLLSVREEQIPFAISFAHALKTEVILAVFLKRHVTGDRSCLHSCCHDLISIVVHYPLLFIQPHKVDYTETQISSTPH